MASCRERVFEAVVVTVVEREMPVTCRDIQQRCDVAPITARRALEKLRQDGRVWRVPIIHPEQETGRYGYLPVDDSLTGYLRIGECDVAGCISVPIIMVTRDGKRWKLCRRCMRGFDEKVKRGFDGERDDRRFALGRVSNRFSSAGSAGGWEPPDRSES